MQIIKYKYVILLLLDLLQFIKNKFLLLVSNSKYNSLFAKFLIMSKKIYIIYGFYKLTKILNLK